MEKVKQRSFIRQANGPWRVRFQVHVPCFLVSSFLLILDRARGGPRAIDAGNRLPGDGPGHFLSPLTLQGSIFIDFLTLQTDIEKSTFFRTIKNQAKWPNKAPLERQGLVFWTKNIRRTPPGAGRFKLHLNQIRFHRSPQPPRRPKTDPWTTLRRGRLRFWPSFFGTHFSHRFSDPLFSAFFRFWSDFGSHFGPFLAPFSDLFASHFSAWFLHCFLMDFWLILGPLNLEFWRFYCRRVTKIETTQFPKFNQLFIDFGPHVGSLFAQFWH